VKIEVWSDIACPWCWLGKHHLEQAIQRIGIEAQVEFRSFELQPQARGTRPVREYLAERYGSAQSIDAAHARLTRAGEAVGIRYDFERALMANTFDAHRLHHLAKARGLGEPLIERLMRARQGEGADVSDRATLRALAVDVGLDAQEVDDVLAGDRFADDVRRDEAEAAAIGVQGVPFFVFDRKLALSGAHPIEVFEHAIREASAN
jgi:predicted DsbA family dithiol-disulfide isomerase